MSGTDTDFPAEINPQDAFQVFSHELRLEILFALWEAPVYSLPFSEIQEAVGERDSGKFTYHLEKLTDHFITEVKGQYVLQYAGHRVIDAIQSGVFHMSPTVDATEAPGTCAHCGHSPVFEYSDHLATVSCPECETKLIEYPFDPGGFQDRSLEQAIVTFDRRTKYKWRLASDGVCFVCAGCVSTTLVNSPIDLDRHDRYIDFFADEHPVVLDLSCQNCSFFSYIPIGIRLLDNPLVVGELAKRGTNTQERLLWELPFITDAELVTVQSRDPWEVLIDAPASNGSLVVTLDSDASIESITSSPM